jgi:hypothetical protein
MQVSVWLIEQDGCRLVAVQECQKRKGLVEAAPAGDDIEVFVVLPVLDSNVDILGRVVSRLVNVD